MQIILTFLESIMLIGCFILFFIVVAILHEGLHIIVFNKFKIPYYFKTLKIKRLPVAFAIYSPYFNTSYADMTKYKKQQYFKIAIVPYFIIIPMCAFIMTVDNLALFIIGFSVCFAHLLNIPLEFVTTYDRQT